MNVCLSVSDNPYLKYAQLHLFISNDCVVAVKEIFNIIHIFLGVDFSFCNKVDFDFSVTQMFNLIILFQDYSEGVKYENNVNV